MKKIYKTFILLILNSAFLIFSCFSQNAPPIQWQNDIGGNFYDFLNSIQQTADKGYILGGWSNSNISGDKTENCIGGGSAEDYWIVKTDTVGTIQWQNTIGGGNQDRLFSIQQTADGGYILGGWSNSDISGDKMENCIGGNGMWDYWIVKTDGSGNIQWQNTIGGNNNDELYCVRQTTDGGYILGGCSGSYISGDKTENSIGNNGLYDYWIVKTDASGNILWQNTIGGNNWDWLNSIQQTTDGGYILGGWSESNISGDKTENSNGGKDYWIVKTDASGNIQWQNTIGGNNDEWLYTIEQTVDGGYIIGGYSYSNISGDKTENNYGGIDYWIVKTDASGNVQWQNTIGGNDDDILYSVRQTADGGCILGGWSVSNISGDKTENSNGVRDYWIVKTDGSGNIQWQNTIGGISYDELYCLQQTADLGYILGGSSVSGISGDKTENSNGTYDYWIVKLFPDTITGIPNFQFPISNFQFSPNPLTNQSKLTFKNPNKEKFILTLYDITGRVCGASPLERGRGCVISTTNDEIILTKGSKQPGVYLFNLLNEKNGESWNGKVVVAN